MNNIKNVTIQQQLENKSKRTFVSAYFSVCISQVATLMKDKNGIGDHLDFVYQLTISTTAFNLGSIVGPLAKSHIIKNYQSHRTPLIVLDILTITFLVLQLFDLNYLLIAFSRLFLGIFVGISTAIVPAYIKNLIPKQVVGYSGTFNQLMQTMGVLICYIGGLVLIGLEKGDQIYWRLFLGFPIVILILRVVALKWVFPFDRLEYENKINQENFIKYLEKTYNSPLLALQQLKEQSKPSSSQYLLEKNQRVHLKKNLICFTLMLSNQATGINSIIFYTKQLFQQIQSGNSDIQTFTLNQFLMILLALAQVISSYASTHTIQHFGRKKILLIGQATIIILLLSIWICSYFNLQSMLFCCIFMHILVHNWSLGSVCIIYAADLLNDLTYVIVILKICSFSVAMSSEYLIEWMGIGSTFLMYGIISFGCFLFLRKELFETKNKSKSEIDQLILQKLRDQKKIHSN